MAKYDPAAVANGFLEMGFRDSVAVDPMKIQKLTFFAHGYYLALTGEPLVREPFQAWKLGPVLPSLYRAMKQYRSSPITDYAYVYDYKLDKAVPAAPPEPDADFIKVRDFVWNSYGKRESITLSNLTHRKDGAWAKTLTANPGIEGPQIPNDFIRKEFDSLVTAEARAKRAAAVG